MWGRQHAQLAERRGELLARSSDLRQRLALEAQSLRRPLALADRARRGLHWLKAHPLALGAVAAVPILLRPRRALAWSLKLWGAWRLWGQVQSMLAVPSNRASPRTARAQSPWKPPAR